MPEASGNHRNATVEQATGILMAAHQIDGPTALGMLRDQAGPGDDELISLSQALIDSHRLFVRGARREAPPEG